MTQGFSGGFFLPAQRSVHCKGGFFSCATRTPAPATATGHNAASSRATPPFPVLFALPQVPPTESTPDAGNTHHPKPRKSRIYDPHEGEEGWEMENEESDTRQQDAEPEWSIRPVATAPRLVRGHRQQQQQAKKIDRAVSRASSSRSNNAIRDAPERLRQEACREMPHGPPATGKGDINTKFEIAMKELHQIKDEFGLKNQRQVDSLRLNAIGNTSDLSLGARQYSAPVLPPRQSYGAGANKTLSPPIASAPPSKAIVSPNQPREPQDSATVQGELQSPRQRLQIAEMVMRKLYKKNLQTELELASTKAEKEQLMTRLAELQAGKNSREETPGPPQQGDSSSSPCCPRCVMTSAVGVVLANPPSMETISRIDSQQLEYLRHLAAEQDRTITSLKRRIEELSSQLIATRQSPTPSHSGKTAKPSTSTPRQGRTKLQTKLKDALSESERQKSNYLTLKRDFQHLLTLKTKTLSSNSTQLDASARQLVALMDRQLQQLESEHARNLSLYNSKLYASEQQTCESYAQQRLLEDEMQRVANDVQQRDALDVEIEQCMANVFERLHHVESENLQLKYAIQSCQSSN